MSKVNELVICKDDYKTKEEFENTIKDAVMLLLNTSNIMTVRYDVNDREMGIVVIEYNYANQECGDRYPKWLLPEEEESVVWQKD